MIKKIVVKVLWMIFIASLYNMQAMKVNTNITGPAIIDVIVFGNNVNIEKDLFIKAIQEQDINAIKNLIAKGDGVENKKFHDVTPLAIACWLGYGNVITLLIDSGANTQTKSYDGFTPLTVLVLKSNFNSLWSCMSLKQRNNFLKLAHAEDNKQFVNKTAKYDAMVKILSGKNKPKNSFPLEISNNIVSFL